MQLKGRIFMNILLSIGGASGGIYGVRLLEELKKSGNKVHLVVSESAKNILKHETDYTFDVLKDKADVYYDDKDLFAAPASGSFKMGIKNMMVAKQSGATILPAMPAFYHKPEEIKDIINFIVGKILDQFNIEHSLFKRWK